MLNAKYHADCLPIAGLIMIGRFMAFFVSLASQMILIVRPPEDHNIKAHSSYEYISKEFDIQVTTYPSSCQAECFERLQYLISFIEPINPF